MRAARMSWISNSESCHDPAGFGGLTCRTRNCCSRSSKCEYEDDAIGTLSKRGLFDRSNVKRWIALGSMANNQSVVHAQQSTAPAAAWSRSSPMALTPSCFAAARPRALIRAASPRLRTCARRCRSGSVISAEKSQRGNPRARRGKPCPLRDRLEVAPLPLVL